MISQSKADRDAIRLASYHMHILSVGYKFGIVDSLAEVRAWTREERTALACLGKLTATQPDIVAAVAREFQPPREIQY